MSFGCRIGFHAWSKWESKEVSLTQVATCRTTGRVLQERPFIEIRQTRVCNACGKLVQRVAVPGVRNAPA